MAHACMSVHQSALSGLIAVLDMHDDQLQQHAAGALPKYPQGDHTISTVTIAIPTNLLAMKSSKGMLTTKEWRTI